MGWTDKDERLLRAPFDYLKNIPGKDLRMVFIKAFNNLLNVPSDKLAIISEIVQTLHTSSLLLDDVEDSAVLRRGHPVAHSVFGTPRTINSANYMVFDAQAKAFGLLGHDAGMIMNTELINLHRGQGMDIFWRDAHVCPTEEEYIEMVLNKTSGLLRLAIRLMQDQAANHYNGELVELANTLGILYQIQDDYLNLVSDQYAENKGFAEDITEGKFSYPIIHNVLSSPERSPVLDILFLQTNDTKLKKKALGYLEASNSLEYTAIKAKEYAAVAKQQVNALQTDAEKKAQLLRLVDSLVLI